MCIRDSSRTVPFIKSFARTRSVPRKAFSLVLNVYICNAESLQIRFKKYMKPANVFNHLQPVFRVQQNSLIFRKQQSVNSRVCLLYTSCTPPH